MATRVNPEKFYLAKATCSFPSGVVTRAGERRSGKDPIVRSHVAWFVEESSTTPEQLAHEESMRLEESMRSARQQGNYYSNPEVGGQPAMRVEPKERVVYVGERMYFDLGDGAGTQIAEPGDVFDLSTDRRKVEALPPEHVKPFEEVFSA